MIELCVSVNQKSDLNQLVEAGATAFAMGIEDFSDRHYNKFTMNELIELRETCRHINVKLNVFVNRMFEEEELDKLKGHLMALKELNVDGIYFSDMGVFALAKELNIENKCIYDPETMVTNGKDANKMIQLGCQGVVAAKEITLEEILDMAKTCDCLEILIHGHQTMSYSKRKLLSNYFRYINQPKEVENKFDLFLMESTRDEKMPIVENQYGTSIFTPYVLMSYSQIKEMIDVGIHRFRIDGMFQSEEELVDAVKNYRSVILGTKSPESACEDMKQKYPHQNYSDGYYYKKTNLTKE